MNPTTSRAGEKVYDVERIRREFPVLKQRIYDHPLVYLDSAATAQKPQTVIDAVDRYYSVDNANVHRGVYTLSERATQAYEATRDKVQGFLNAAQRDGEDCKGVTIQAKRKPLVGAVSVKVFRVSRLIGIKMVQVRLWHI